MVTRQLPWQQVKLETAAAVDWVSEGAGELPVLLSRVVMTTGRVSLVTSRVSLVTSRVSMGTTVPLSKYDKGGGASPTLS